MELDEIRGNAAQTKPDAVMAEALGLIAEFVQRRATASDPVSRSLAELMPDLKAACDGKKASLAYWKAQERAALAAIAEAKATAKAAEVPVVVAPTPEPEVAVDAEPLPESIILPVRFVPADTQATPQVAAQVIVPPAPAPIPAPPPPSAVVKVEYDDLPEPHDADCPGCEDCANETDDEQN